MTATVSTEPGRVLVALSGGVDSSACVYLLQQQGYEVEAVVLNLSPAHAATVEAAQETAALLGIPLHVVQRHEAFMQYVVLPFCNEYRAGRTPNPCVICNPTTKFHFILEAANELGFDFIATGHYAAIEHCTNGTQEHWLLKKAACLPRDQSYMLYRLGQKVLSRLLLPLQQLTKAEVRAIAAQAGLPCATRPDSQEICFIPDNNYPAYIEALLGPSPVGDYISPEGKPCGKHRGILHYTVGQRKGLGIALGQPVFIRQIDAASNRIYLAYAGDEYAREVLLERCVVQPHPAWGTPEVGATSTATETPTHGHAAQAAACLPAVPLTRQLAVKIRSMATPAPAQVTVLPTGQAQVVFATPQRAPAPGQSVVWYLGDTVLGGGFITAATPQECATAKPF